MKTLFSKQFSKQLDLLNDKSLLKKISDVVNSVMKAEDIRQIKNMKKMKGHSSAYRIRLGDYRIGLFMESDTAIFAILAHRKDIYNRFP